MYVCMHVCMHACMGGWMDGWMDGWTDVCVYICIVMYIHMSYTAAGREGKDMSYTISMWHVAVDMWRLQSDLFVGCEPCPSPGRACKS